MVHVLQDPEGSQRQRCWDQCLPNSHLCAYCWVADVGASHAATPHTQEALAPVSTPPPRPPPTNIMEQELFHSENLTYDTIDYVSDKFLHSIQADSKAYTGSTTSLLRPPSKKDIAKWRTHLAEESLLGVFIRLAPSDGSSDISPIGVISLTSPTPGKEHHRNSYIEVDIKDDYRNKGYGREAIEWVLNWGFQIAGLHRIGIECMSYNEGAMRLYDRLGFVVEGRERECIWFNGGWHDMVIYGMLEGEWRQRPTVTRPSRFFAPNLGTATKYPLGVEASRV